MKLNYFAFASIGLMLVLISCSPGKRPTSESSTPEPATKQEDSSANGDLGGPSAQKPLAPALPDVDLCKANEMNISLLKNGQRENVCWDGKSNIVDSNFSIVGKAG